MATRDRTLRDQVLRLLGGGNAHLSFEEIVRGFPPGWRGRTVRGLPHTPWRLLEHLRIAQWDILEFVRDPGHVSPTFPEGYWPATDAPPDPEAWRRSVAAFRADGRAMRRLVRDGERDLLAPIPHARGATILWEALLVADHNAYHLGQLVVLRRLLAGRKAGSRRS